MSGKVRYFFAPDPERWDTGRIVHMNEHGGYDCIYKAYYNAKHGFYTLYAPGRAKIRLNVYEVDEMKSANEIAELWTHPVGTVGRGYSLMRAENGLIKANKGGRGKEILITPKVTRQKKNTSTADKTPAERQLNLFDL